MRPLRQAVLIIVISILIVGLAMVANTQPTKILSVMAVVIFILFLPGFVVSCILFSDRQIDLIERATISYLLSIGTVPVISYYLSKVGVKINPFSVAAVAIVIITMGIAIYSSSMIKHRSNNDNDFNKIAE